MLISLLLLACQKPSESGESCSLDGERVSFTGFTHTLTSLHTGDPVSGVEVYDIEQPCNRTESDEEGLWELDFAAEKYIHFYLEKPGFVPTMAHVDPIIEKIPAIPWPTSAATLEEIQAVIHNLLGVEVRSDASVLIIDILDGMGQGLPGGQILVDREYDGSYDRNEEGVWTNTNVSSGSSDIVFLNVDPGTVQLSGLAPDGTPCRTPPPFEAVAATLVLSTVYCDQATGGE